MGILKDFWYATSVNGLIGVRLAFCWRVWNNWRHIEREMVFSWMLCGHEIPQANELC